MFDTLSQTFTSVFQFLGGKPRLTEKNIDESLQRIRVALLEADVNAKVVREFIERVKQKAVGAEVLQAEGLTAGDHFCKVVYDEVVGLLGEPDHSIHFSSRGPTVILMAGLQGSGKTTTCGKLAHMLAQEKGKKPLLVAADVQRPAAIEQLKVVGAQVGVPVYAEDTKDPPGICERSLAEAQRLQRDVIILDTAGRLHVDDDLMAELEQVAKRARPHEIFLVVDGMTGQDAVNSTAAFNARLEISGVILTKLDGDTRGGAALTIRHVTGKPIKFVGMGEKFDALQPFHPDRMANRITGLGDVASLVERAQAAMNRDDALKMQEKLFSARFTLEDLMEQLKAVRRMGQMKDLVKLIPGMGDLGKQMEQVDDGELDRFQAIVSSMTGRERRNPHLIDGARRRRIAMGSGTTTADVNSVLKMYRDMHKMMEGRGKLGAMMQNMMMNMGEAAGGMMERMQQARKGTPAVPEHAPPLGKKKKSKKRR